MTSANPPTDYRCDTGACPQVTYTGDTVTIVENANPEQVVVTSAEKWDAYLDTVRAPFRDEVDRLRKQLAEAHRTIRSLAGQPGDLAAGGE